MKIEGKFEVDKGDVQNYFFTGTLSEFDNQHYQIDTIRGEHLVFRKEQIVEIQKKGSDKNDNKC